MTSDQRRCMQRSRFVCRILILCVKKVLLQNTPVGTGIRRSGFAASRRTERFEAFMPMGRICSDLR